MRTVSTFLVEEYSWDLTLDEATEMFRVYADDLDELAERLEGRWYECSDDPRGIANIIEAYAQRVLAESVPRKLWDYVDEEKLVEAITDCMAIYRVHHEGQVMYVLDNNSIDWDNLYNEDLDLMPIVENNLEQRTYAVSPYAFADLFGADVKRILEEAKDVSDVAQLDSDNLKTYECWNDVVSDIESELSNEIKYALGKIPKFLDIDVYVRDFVGQFVVFLIKRDNLKFFVLFRQHGGDA
jgi:hypothetical protein